EPAGPPNQILRSRDATRCGSGPQFSKAHVKFLPLTSDCASVTMESRSGGAPTRTAAMAREGENRGEDAAWIFHDAGASAGTFVHRDARRRCRKVGACR